MLACACHLWQYRPMNDGEGHKGIRTHHEQGRRHREFDYCLDELDKLVSSLTGESVKIDPAYVIAALEVVLERMKARNNGNQHLR